MYNNNTERDDRIEEIRSALSQRRVYVPGWVVNFLAAWLPSGVESFFQHTHQTGTEIDDWTGFALFAVDSGLIVSSWRGDECALEFVSQTDIETIRVAAESSFHKSYDNPAFASNQGDDSELIFRRDVLTLGRSLSLSAEPYEYDKQAFVRQLLHRWSSLPA